MRLRTYLDSMRVLGVLAALAGCGGEETDKAQTAEDAGGKNDAAAAAPKDVCDTLCARAEAASCANGETDCVADCDQRVSETPPRCKTQLDAFTSCASNARFSCDDEGDAVVPACDAQLEAWASCATSDAGTKLDASTDGGDASTGEAAICPLSDNEATCGVCVKFSCCEEILACGAACQQLVQCANACPSTSSTDPCAQACFVKYPEGMAAFTAFAGCLGTQCEDACSTTN